MKNDFIESLSIQTLAHIQTAYLSGDKCSIKMWGLNDGLIHLLCKPCISTDLSAAISKFVNETNQMPFLSENLGAFTTFLEEEISLNLLISDCSIAGMSQNQISVLFKIPVKNLRVHYQSGYVTSDKKSTSLNDELIIEEQLFEQYGASRLIQTSAKQYATTLLKLSRTLDLKIHLISSVIDKMDFKITYI